MSGVRPFTETELARMEPVIETGVEEARPLERWVTFTAYGANAVPVPGMTDVPARFKPRVDPYQDAPNQIEDILIVRREALPTPVPELGNHHVRIYYQGVEGSRYGILRIVPDDETMRYYRIELRSTQQARYGPG